MNWQPIDTAPKDACVLAFCPVAKRIVIAFWRDDRYAKRPRPYWATTDEMIYGKLAVRADQPTHWMPLPEPPK